jgi:hypothetical protein
MSGEGRRVLTMPGSMSLLRSVGVEVVVEPRRLFRICRAEDDDAFGDAFRSNYELGRPPRGPEGRVAVIHMALSMFDSPDIAQQIATRFPKIGDHIAVVDLRPDLGLCVAKTGAPSHWSVWGRPDHLAACIISVANVDERGLS